MGGKSKLLPQIITKIVTSGGFNTYAEPFFGGGAVFFGLEIPIKRAILSDLNPMPIAIYKEIQNNTKKFWQEFECLGKRFWKEGPGFYLYLRNCINRTPAQNFFLIHAGFNGLIRTNKEGKWTTAPGDKYFDGCTNKSGKKLITETITRRRVGEASDKLYGAELYNCGYQQVALSLKEGDFLYVDPPYSFNKDGTNSQYSYGSQWGEKEDKELYDILNELTKRKVKWILSNVIDNYGKHNELYDQLYCQGGYKTIKQSYKYTIGTNGANCNELIVSNF
jgi:DNA adenine methylase Dam